jgi:hypothetical protein
VPVTVSEALEQIEALTKPKFIKVWTNTKYPEILDYDFKGTKFVISLEPGGAPIYEPSPDPLEEIRKAQQDQAYSAMGREGNYSGYSDDEIPF